MNWHILLEGNALTWASADAASAVPPPPPGAGPDPLSPASPAEAASGAAQTDGEAERAAHS